MKYKNFSEVPSTSVVGIYKDLGTKLANGTIHFESLAAYVNAPKNVREQIDKLLDLDGIESILTKRKRFGIIARSKNIPLYHDNETGTDDYDKYNWLPNAIVSNTPPPKGKWKQIDKKNGTNEETMLITAQKMHLYQAMDVFIQELENGTFDKKQIYRKIFLEETDICGNRLELVCVRYPADVLRLYLLEVSLKRTWSTDDASWFEQQDA